MRATGLAGTKMLDSGVVWATTIMCNHACIRQFDTKAHLDDKFGRSSHSHQLQHFVYIIMCQQRRLVVDMRHPQRRSALQSRPSVLTCRSPDAQVNAVDIVRS